MPTYIEYSAEFQELFVCESGEDQILHFDLRIHSGVLKASSKQILLRDVACGGLEFDAFHNLFYVDRAKEEINKIIYEEILIHNSNFGVHPDGGAPDPVVARVYNSFTAKELKNV